MNQEINKIRIQGFYKQAFNRKPLFLMVKPLKPLFFSEKTFKKPLFEMKTPYFQEKAVFQREINSESVMLY